EGGDPRHALLDVGIAATADALIEADHGTQLRVAIRSGRRPGSSPDTQPTSTATSEFTTGAASALTATRGSTMPGRSSARSAPGVKKVVRPTTPIACSAVSPAATIICGSVHIMLTGRDYY